MKETSGPDSPSGTLTPHSGWRGNDYDDDDDDDFIIISFCLFIPESVSSNGVLNAIIIITLLIQLNQIHNFHIL